MFAAPENPRALCGRMQHTQPTVSSNFFPLSKASEVSSPEQQSLTLALPTGRETQLLYWLMV